MGSGESTVYSSLVQMALQVEASDGVLVEVTLLVGGAPMTGWLISEVRYREILATTVRAGTAAAAAPAFDVVTEEARQRREETARRHDTRRRGSTLPPPPEFLYLLEGGGSTRTWCLPITTVNAWSMDTFNIAADGE